MAKKENFSFKKVKHTGRYRSFEPEIHYIKLGGLQVGYIQTQRTFAGSRPDDGFMKINFYVKDEHNNQRKIVTLKKNFNTGVEARNFIIEHQEALKKKFDFYKQEMERNEN